MIDGQTCRQGLKLAGRAEAPHQLQVWTLRLAAASLCVSWSVASVLAEELQPSVTINQSASAPLPSDLSAVPPEFDDVAPLLHHLVGSIQSLADTQAELKHLRIENDEHKTKLSAVDSELALIDQEQRQVTAQLAALERSSEERLLSLRKELQTKLAGELAATRAQIAQDTQHEFDQQLQAFQARQEELVGKTLDRELALKEQELQQLGEEINVQTQELLDRLARLEANPELAKSLERSTTQALEKRRAVLDARRAQVASERRDILSRQRNEFVQQLTEQREVESQRRLTFKEASLHSAMAELLRTSERDTRNKVDRMRKDVEQVQQRHNKLVQQQALVRARMEELDHILEAKTASRERLEEERRIAIAKLEAALLKTGQDTVHPEALAWFGRTIRYLPAPVAAELIPMQQRLVSTVEQEERLREQRRIVRERQQALQFSREMADQHRKIEERQQREQAVRSRNAEELLAKADRLAAKGEFDQALELLAQAQAINPPQLDRIAMLHEQLLATKTERERQTQTAQLERLFRRAKTAFDAGRYEEAMVLFEQVIAQEAATGQSSTVASQLVAEGAARGAVP